MLTVKQEYLSTDELAQLRKWLGDPGARLFRKLVQARIQENQIKATQEFASERVRGPEDGVKLLSDGAPYRDTLKVMDEFSDTTSKPYTVKILEEL